MLASEGRFGLSNAYGNLIHSKVLTTIGSSRSIGHSTCICSRGSTVGSVSVKIIHHFRVKLFRSLCLWATSIATTTARTPRATTAPTTSRSVISSSLGGSGGLWLSLRLTGTVLDMATSGRSKTTYAIRSLRALTGTGGGALDASITTSI